VYNKREMGREENPSGEKENSKVNKVTFKPEKEKGNRNETAQI